MITDVKGRQSYSRNFCCVPMGQAAVVCPWDRRHRWAQALLLAMIADSLSSLAPQEQPVPCAHKTPSFGAPCHAYLVYWVAPALSELFLKESVLVGRRAGKRALNPVLII